MSKARYLPITPKTVEINGSVYRADCTIWAGLRLHEAALSGDRLRVPWCHINDDWEAGGCVYKLDPRKPGYRFAQARNGAWVLERVG